MTLPLAGAYPAAPLIRLLAFIILVGMDVATMFAPTFFIGPAEITV